MGGMRLRLGEEVCTRSLRWGVLLIGDRIRKDCMRGYHRLWHSIRPSRGALLDALRDRGSG